MDIKRIFFRGKQPAKSETGFNNPESTELPQDASLEEKVIAAIRTVYDPEIPVNIYDLGLIYGLHINDDASVEIKMTLTAPACPVAETLPAHVESVIRSVKGVTDAKVELVWEPPWNQERMSDEAKLTLGLF